MAFQIPEIGFALDALEPFISKRTLDYHYNKHHKKYYENLNKLVTGTRYESMPLEEVIVESHERDPEIFNNAAQAENHNFFWKCLSPDRQEPTPSLVQSLENQFGSMQNFKEQFAAVGGKLFGSGWVWLVRNRDLTLEIMPMSDAGTPLTADKVPLLACDVWEHAYYLDYQNERPVFIKNFWQIINWKFLEKNLTIERTVLQNQARQAVAQSMYH